MNSKSNDGFEIELNFNCRFTKKDSKEKNKSEGGAKSEGDLIK